ncbi:MAG: hypothetical protein WEB04_05785 [Dehalococcoidia bacterium]
MSLLSVYCADIGSIKSGKFGWAREDSAGSTEAGTDISDLVRVLAVDLQAGTRVALGFECPLYVPISDDPVDLTSQRRIDMGKPWSAGAGPAVLATGLTETVWILERLRKQLGSPPPAFLDWSSFGQSERGLFLWEAMVTGEAKGASHQEDAAIAVGAFRTWALEARADENSTVESVHSLIGAALLRAGWSDDISLLRKPCLVVRA